MKKGALLRGAAMALTLAVMATPAMAGTTTDLLKRLHEKGILSDEEYAELLKSESSPAAQAPAAAASSPDDKPVVRIAGSGVGLQVGDVTLKFSGSVNGFYVHDDGEAPSATNSVVGGVATVGGDSSAVRNGLLPGFLKVEATTNQGGWDVGAHFGMYPGINSVSYTGGGANSPGNPRALQTSGIDFRQTYLTFGRPGFGEVKIGRDIGLFQSESILNDITLLSSGTPAGNVAPSNTTLGRIGVGYIYTDFQPQITYTSPSFGGLTVSIGVFEPLSSTTGPSETNKQPGFQAKIVYDRSFGGVATRLWLSGLTQKHNVDAGPDYTGAGWDAGARIGFGPVTLVGTYYDASGLGTTGLNVFDTDGLGNKRDSHGFYLQGLATFGKVSVGGSYGESNLDYANAADALANPTLVDRNSSWVGQLRYGLTSWVTLIGEYVHTRSEAHNGNRASSDALAIGGVLFF
ncbi:porin [Sphingobium ummariense]